MLPVVGVPQTVQRQMRLYRDLFRRSEGFEYVWSNRTCEIGMNLATGKDYRSVIFLLEELTRV